MRERKPMITQVAGMYKVKLVVCNYKNVKNFAMIIGSFPKLFIILMLQRWNLNMLGSHIHQDQKMKY